MYVNPWVASWSEISMIASIDGYREVETFANGHGVCWLIRCIDPWKSVVRAVSKGSDRSLLHPQEHLLKRNSRPIVIIGLLSVCKWNCAGRYQSLISSQCSLFRSNTEFENGELVGTCITRVHRLTHLVYNSSGEAMVERLVSVIISWIGKKAWKTLRVNCSEWVELGCRFVVP